VTGDRRDPKTDTSLDPGLQIPAIVRHTSLAKPGCRSPQRVDITRRGAWALQLS